MAQPRVLVGRHRVLARVVGPTCAGEAAVRRAVADGLADALEDVPVDDGYWILRELDVRTRLGAAWSSGRMSRVLARDIAGAVADVRARGTDPERALWFPDRAAFLARFLQDLAEGRAHGRWEYAGLGALLRPGSTLEGLARDEPAELVAALVSLPLGVLERVVGLTADEEAVLALLPAAPGPPARSAVLASLRDLVAAGRRRGPLVLAVVTAREHGLPVARVVPTAVEVAAATRLTERGGPGAVAAVRAGDWAMLAAHGDDFLPLVAWPGSARARLADALTPGHDGPAPSPEPAERVHTPFGGAILLAPLLDDLADWTAEPDADRLRLLVLAAALDRGTTAPLHDPVLRDLYAMTSDDDPSGLLSGPVPDRVARTADDLLASLGRRLPGMAGASPAYLRTNVLDLDARVGHGDGERTVELGRPPLAVLLSISGLSSGSFRVRGHEEVRWTLTTAP